MPEPRPIPSAHKKNFNALLRAAKNGDVCLMSALTQEDVQVYLICAVGRDGEEYLVYPFAQMIDGNPFELYKDPTVVSDKANS